MTCLLQIPNRFYLECAFYMGYFSLMVITLIVKRLYFNWMREKRGCTYQLITVIQTVDVQLTAVNSSTCRCAYFYADDPYVGVSVKDFKEF